MTNRPKLTITAVTAILFLLSFSSPSLAQNNRQELLSKSDSLNALYPQEKIYLHLDRQSYLADDDIWFKAYVINPAVKNFNLYVELINPEGEILCKNLSLAQYGLSYGDFHLADTLFTGMYRIRAYTNWMRNFNDQWFFHKDILIINPRDAGLVADSVRLRKRDIDLQFFPEGGTFLANQINRVAFKAVDKNGKGIDIEGEIVDRNGNKILDIQSNFKGMGSFWITPSIGMNYSANVTVAGHHTINVNLPKPQDFGVMLSADVTDSADIYLQVSRNNPGSNISTENEYLLVGQSGGTVCFAGEVKLSDETSIFKIGKNTLPGGIVKFTLFNQNMLPYCERLVFNNYLDTIHVNITPDKLRYKTREKVKIDIETLNHDNTPTYTNLSMSVYSNASEYKTEDYPNNIFTSILLDSELKGTIEEPAYYFKDDSLSTRIALDNLLLTHGYRYFEWEEIIEDEMPDIEYLTDSCLSVSGRVTSLILNKPLANCKISMISVKSLLNVYETKSDSVGDFQFTNLYFKDTILFTMQAKARKERQNTSIELYAETPPPTIKTLPTIYKSFEKNEVQTYTYLSELSPELLKKKWHISDTILLADINVVARKQEEIDTRSSSYIEADYTIDMTKFDNVGLGILETLEASSGAARSFLPRCSTFYLDGVKVDKEFITSTPQSWFEKVEFIRMAPIERGWGPAAYFYLIKEKNQVKDSPTKTTAAQIVGYSVFRKFYSPKYKANDIPEVKDDFRRTIYWDPLIRTYTDGKAEVSFYTSDETGKVSVVVEGVTYDGKLCRGTASFDVNSF